MLDTFDSAATMVAALRPDEPIVALRPHVLAERARAYVAGFPGDVLYAVKCNQDPNVLRALHDGGIRHFDVASPKEIRTVAAAFPGSGMAYMHPVKTRAAIAEAWRDHGVRTFAFDCAAELDKLIEASDDSADLVPVVRIEVPRGAAILDLGGKFGATVDEAAALLARAATTGDGRPRRVGITFHVGSQCLDPEAWTRAIGLAGMVRDRAGVPVTDLDVGGGFPADYTDQAAPLERFVAAIRDAMRFNGFGPQTHLSCEPGRALVAPGVSIVVRVVLRKGNALYINDGVYGRLDELKMPGFRHPLRLIRPDAASKGTPADFRLFGPTCDPIDTLDGPFSLPSDVVEGDWIEIGQAGAYSTAVQTDFNGFGDARTVQLADAPMVATGPSPHRRAA